MVCYPAPGLLWLKEYGGDTTAVLTPNLPGHIECFSALGHGPASWSPTKGRTHRRYVMETHGYMLGATRPSS